LRPQFGTGPPFCTLILDLDLGHPYLGPFFWTHLGPPFWTLFFDLDLGHPHLGPLSGTAIWDPDLGPQFGMPNVISKIKQNSSDMNEIILAPCDAGYVQNCTGFTLLLPI
jgi:hypothetical protein